MENNRIAMLAGWLLGAGLVVTLAYFIFESKEEPLEWAV
jgi:hypothetical protein